MQCEECRFRGCNCRCANNCSIIVNDINFVSIAIVASSNDKKKKKSTRKSRKRKDVLGDALDEDIEIVDRLLRKKKKTSKKRKIIEESEDESGGNTENVKEDLNQNDIDLSKETLDDTRTSDADVVDESTDNHGIERNVEMESREDAVGGIQRMEGRQIENKEIETSPANDDGIKEKTVNKNDNDNDEKMDIHRNMDKGKEVRKKAPPKRRGRPPKKGKAAPRTSKIKDDGSNSAGKL